jgi:hypothetical protein
MQIYAKYATMKIHDICSLCTWYFANGLQHHLAAAPLRMKTGMAASLLVVALNSAAGF